jgi:protoporphyrinogen oxidase
MKSHDYDSVIVGAGIAGLSCAYELQRKGQRVLVLESDTHVGGRVRVLHWAGGHSDTGAQFFGKLYPRIQRYLTEFELTRSQRKGPARLGFLKSGEHFEISTRNPFALLRFVGVSSLVKLMGHFVLTPHMKDLDLEDPHFWLTLDHESARDWAKRELGDEWHDQLIAPTLSGFNYTSSEAAAAFLAAKNLAYMRRQETVCALPEGLTTLLEKMAERLDVRCQKTVDRIERTRHGVRVHSGQESFLARHVILATTASTAKKLFENPSPTEKTLMQTSYGQSVWQGFHFKSPTTLKAYGHLLIDHPLFNVLSVERLKHPSLAEGELLHVLSSQVGFDYYQEHGEEKLKNQALELIAQMTGLKDLEAHAIHAWPEAIPHTPPGRLTTIDNYRRSLTGREDVLLIGDYVGMPCTEGAVESAQFIAKLLNARL